MAIFSRKNIKSNSFGLTEEDLIGFIKGFPIGVVVRMLEEQVLQGNNADVKVFQSNNEALREDNGFDWIKTEDKLYFWQTVVRRQDFDLFFEKYPEYKKYNLN